MFMNKRDMCVYTNIFSYVPGVYWQLRLCGLWVTFTFKAAFKAGFGSKRGKITIWYKQKLLYSNMVPYVDGY